MSEPDPVDSEILSTTPTNSVRGRMPRSERRQQLLDAARQVFVASGYHQAAMDDIAERAGVSKPVLYQHFPGKLELYLGLLDTHIKDLTVLIEDAMGRSTENRERVHAAVEAYFEFVDSGSEGYRLVFESDLRNDPRVGKRVAAAEDACVDAIARSIAGDTGIDLTRARLLGVGLVGVSVASARAWQRNREVVSRADAIDQVTALMWGGLSAIPLTHKPDEDE